MSANDDLIAEKLMKIRELQSRRLAGEVLSDDELREGLTLIADVRGLRAGKVSKEKGEKVAAASKQDLADMF